MEDTDFDEPCSLELKLSQKNRFSSALGIYLGASKIKSNYFRNPLAHLVDNKLRVHFYLGCVMLTKFTLFTSVVEEPSAYQNNPEERKAGDKQIWKYRDIN
jgi:hypothetical protein